MASFKTYNAWGGFGADFKNLVLAQSVENFGVEKKKFLVKLAKSDF